MRDVTSFVTFTPHQQQQHVAKYLVLFISLSSACFVTSYQLSSFSIIQQDCNRILSSSSSLIKSRQQHLNLRYEASKQNYRIATTTSTGRRIRIKDTKLYDRLTKHEIEVEEARVKILNSRRRTIRSTLRIAEKFRNNRIGNGDVPEIDPDTGKPIKQQNDSKAALSLTAFVVAIGAITLRVGGRAALLNVVGLDFLSDSPELKDNLDTVLDYTDNMDFSLKLLSFIAAWTVVKVSCIDAGGVVLALSSGILFGGVVQGAIISAASATIGSLAAFGLAKLDTPVRNKALELLDQYPSLRGIDKVVAKDGLKAVLTLRLAPILPIPIGLYNYIYGVTNVPILSFAGGIFLGSLKPYFLDSYIGYFGKDIVQGNVDPSGIQDFLLLGALGVSVLIGVFASQLASETWDTVIEEVEAEKMAKALAIADTNSTGINNDDDGIIRQFLGFAIPEFFIGAQIVFQQADRRLQDLVNAEYQAKVWNYTKVDEPIPDEINPAMQVGSPEMEHYNTGINLVDSLCEGFVLSPVLFKAFLKYSDPLYDESKELVQVSSSIGMLQASNNTFVTQKLEQVIPIPIGQNKNPLVLTDTSTVQNNNNTNADILSPQTLLYELQKLRIQAEQQLSALDDRIQNK